MKQVKPFAVEEPDSAFATLLVSLNILLLTFFLFLNTIAKVEPQRSKEIMGEIQDHFRAKQGTVIVESLTSEGKNSKAEQFFVDLTLWYKDHAILNSIDIEQAETTLTLRSPASLWFEKGKTSLQPEQRQALESLQQMITERYPDMAFRMEATLAPGEDPLLPILRLDEVAAAFTAPNDKQSLPFHLRLGDDAGKDLILTWELLP